MSFLTNLLVYCLCPFCLFFFTEFCSVISVGSCFFVSSFCHSPCVCFYVLGRVATSPRLGSMAECSRVPVRSSGTPSLITQAGYSRCPHHLGCVHPPLVVKPWLLVACPRSSMPVLYLGSHSINYRAICRWLLLVLGLEMGRQGRAVHQG